MAKVKDQIRDRSEVSYIDAAGRTCYLDELFRHIMPDAYPLPSLNPTGVVKKSSRGHNGPTQGDGSPEQLPWRMCFQECTDRWNSLPDKCSPNGSCDELSSKKNVFDAKQAQGVMCSYFDLYMSCCMKSCTKISITGRDGYRFSGGTIGSSEGCWPCPPVDKSEELSIGYTTQQMSVNQQQELTAEGLLFSGLTPCCDPNELSWELSSGGGSLDTGSGASAVYTAPSANPDCLSNATIELSDCYGRSASLQIAINTYGDTSILAYSALDSCTDTTPPDTCELPSHWIYAIAGNYEAYGCDGQQIIIEGQGPCVASGYLASLSGSCCQENPCGKMPEHDCSTVLAMAETVCPSGDHRTFEMIEQGCCPEQAL